jgi:hypothetical protein
MRDTQFYAGTSASTVEGSVQLLGVATNLGQEQRYV